MLHRFDDPAPPLATTADHADAIARGGRLRRRRRVGAAASGLVLLALCAAALSAVRSDDPSRVETVGQSAGYCAALAELQPLDSRFNGFDVVVWFEPGTADDVLMRARTQIEEDPRTEGPVRFVDAEAAYEEWLRLFDPQGDLDSAVTPENLPASARFRLVDPAEAPRVASDYNGLEGVREAMVVRDIARWRFVDIFLRPFLGDTASGHVIRYGPAVDASFGDWGLGQLSRVEDAAPVEVSADVGMLAEAVRTEVGPSDPVPGADVALLPSRTAAAERVRDDARSRCGFDPLDPPMLSEGSPTDPLGTPPNP